MGRTRFGPYSGPRPGPIVTKWHSWGVRIPATVIAESPSTHLSPLQSRTVRITVLLPAGLWGVDLELDRGRLALTQPA